MRGMRRAFSPRRDCPPCGAATASKMFRRLAIGGRSGGVLAVSARHLWRCRAVRVERSKLAAIADCGVELEEFDHAAQQANVRVVRPKLAGGEDELRRLERVLRPRCGAILRMARRCCASRRLLDSHRGEQPFAMPPSRLRMAAHQAADGRRPSRKPTSAWGVTLLLTLGSLAFFAGVGLLAVANSVGRRVRCAVGAADDARRRRAAHRRFGVAGGAAMAAQSARLTCDSIRSTTRLGDVQATLERTAGGVVVGRQSAAH